MDQTPPRKPKLLYLGPSYDTLIVPNNQETIVERCAAWLDFHFDVTHITSDCSLAEMVERHEPELILYDAIVEGLSEHRLKIRDKFAHPSIPRAGWCRVDSLSPTRKRTFEFLMELGCEAVFVLGDTGMGETLPDFKSRIFYVPQFINPKVFRDYGVEKQVPVLLVGNFDSRSYPWRREVKDALVSRFPTLYMRHPGYEVGIVSESPLLVYGEKFARLINSSYITPTSGGFKNIAISKHVEIPGARSCLVTDSTQGVRMFGFEHMKSCVYATSDEAPDAIDQLLRNPDLLARITDAGHDLVHNSHTLAHRKQLIQWLRLRQSLQNEERIIQPDPMADLEKVREGTTRETRHEATGDDRRLLREGDKLREANDLTGAEELYRQAQALCSYMIEPRLRIAICWLLRGQPGPAACAIIDNIAFYSGDAAAREDPVDAAYLIIALACLGQEDDAMRVAQRQALIRHQTLDCARWALSVGGDGVGVPFDLQTCLSSKAPRAPSIHQLPLISPIEQIQEFVRMFYAAKRYRRADRMLTELRSAASQSRGSAQPESPMY